MTDELHDAVQRGDVDAARRLLASGANADADAVWGLPLLPIALERLDLPMARLLIASGAEPPPDLLHRASTREQARLAIDLGFDPDQGDRDGWTPLHFAAAYGNLEVAHTLIDAGASPAALTAAGHAPRDLATRNRHDWPF